MKRTRILAMLWNLALGVITAWAWLSMALGGGDGTLTAVGVASLKFYTVLSNLLSGLVSLICAGAMIPVLRGKRERMPRWLHLLKYVATAAVALTFFVVTAFFVPLYGLLDLYRGPNFWFHLTLPLAAVLEFCLLETEYDVPLRHTPAVMAPPLIYGIGYLINLLVNGVGYGPDSNDWYGFAIWGIPVGLAIFGIILLATWGLGLLIRWGSLAFGRRRTRAAAR